MTSLSLQPKIRSLLIVRMSAMGDIIHAMPAVAALREVYPTATIGWVVEERWAELLSSARSCSGSATGRRLADKIHIVNTKKWRTAVTSSATRQEITKVVKELRAMEYEAAVDFQGLIRSAVLANLSGAKTVYGYAQPRERAARIFYTKQVAARGEHIVEKNLSLAESVVDRKLTAAPSDLPTDEIAEKDSERWLHEHEINNFVILNPGAGWASKQWPPERYGGLAKDLGHVGFKSLINAGPGEQTLAQTVKATSEGTAEIVECSIPQLIAFTRRASLFVGGDTGPIHLAAALGVPVVAIFGPTNPARNGPYGTRSIVLRSPSSQTNHSQRAQLDPGLLEISSEEVFAASQNLLGAARG
jgi:heptosyltransferase-1